MLSTIQASLIFIEPSTQQYFLRRSVQARGARADRERRLRSRGSMGDAPHCPLLGRFALRPREMPTPLLEGPGFKDSWAMCHQGCGGTGTLATNLGYKVEQTLWKPVWPIPTKLNVHLPTIQPRTPWFRSTQRPYPKVHDSPNVETSKCPRGGEKITGRGASLQRSAVQ